jgi:hypothetical protein
MCHFFVVLEEVTHKKFLLVRQEGNRKVNREMDHYNLDVIIALGYRVQFSEPPPRYQPN